MAGLLVDSAPSAVRVALWVSVLVVALTAASIVGILFDPDLSWGGWNNVTLFDANIADVGVAQGLVGLAAVGGLSVAAIIGLVNRQRWGQFLAIVMSGASALEGAYDLVQGRLNLVAPIMLIVAWSLFREPTWFDQDSLQPGPPALS